MKRSQFENFNKIVEQIYTAIEVDEQHWANIADNITNLFPHSWTWIGDVNTSAKKMNINAICENTNIDIFQEFQKHFNNSENPMFRFINEMPVGQFVDRRGYMPDEMFTKTELFNLWQRGGIYNCGSTILDINSSRISTLIMSRETGKEYWAGFEIQMLEQLSNHLRQALRLRRKLDEGGAKNKAMLTALDRLTIAIALIGERGEVLHINQELDRLLRHNDGLKVQGGRLEAARSSDQKGLDALVNAALAAGQGHIQNHECTTIARPSGQRPYLLTATSLLDSGEVLRERSLKAAVIVSDPEAEAKISREALVQLFGVTPREAEIAALLTGGRTLDESAKKLGIARETASAHLKRTLQKTDCRRQAELVKLILHSPAAQILKAQRQLPRHY